MRDEQTPGKLEVKKVIDLTDGRKPGEGEVESVLITQSIDGSSIGYRMIIQDPNIKEEQKPSSQKELIPIKYSIEKARMEMYRRDREGYDGPMQYPLWCATYGSFP